MTFSIAKGQYVARDSVVHRLDTRVKVVACLAYAVALFALPGWGGLAACGTLFALSYRAARLPWTLALRAFKPLAFLLVLTVVCSMFTFSAGSGASGAGGGGSAGGILDLASAALANAAPLPDPLGTCVANVLATGTVPLVGSFGITLTGLANGILLALRVALFLAATSLLTSTSTLVDIADAVGALLRPLARFGFPAEDAAVVVALTLRFVPAIMEEADRIKRAQQARGLQFDHGGLMRRAQAFVPVLVPWFTSLFNRAERLACALEARCYTGEGRTHLRDARG